ncbi:hypothetical protein [Thiomicrorhabdus sp. Milos-T2]|uniref:hypothetical protein n=1 Tax=Thiomicrorhabdus sp. Milos-T2 TaxID=90814 RepID=UPI00056F09DF|nr:hypothetical protein [Thiomicrorhabdus sp. Milos-T2]
MKLKWLLLMLALQVGLSACSSKPVKIAKNALMNVGEDVGLIEKSVMKVPDYYSTKPLPKKYEPGVKYNLKDLNCSETQNKC